MKTMFMCVNYPKYNPSIGISKKISTQIEAFQTLGFRVIYSAYLKDGIAIYEDERVIYERHYKDDRLNSVFRRFRLFDVCIQYLKNNKFDLGFVRWNAVDEQFLRLLSLMKDNCGKVLMDFHGYFPKYNSPGVKGLYTKYTTKLFGSRMSRYVGLGLTETKNNNLFGIHTIPMDTGINVEKYVPHIYTGEKNEIHMISVANERAYHGYDRVIKGVEQYYQSKHLIDVYLHLVGKMSNETEKMITQLGLEDRIVLHGYQSGDSLTRIYNQCNIGVGPIAPHRTGGKEGTGIKTKEYFAIGLPYFYAGQELLVPDDYPYILKITADDTPVNIKKIIEFYDSIKNDSLMQENMRDFAREHYSWEKVFSKAVSLMGVD